MNSIIFLIIVNVILISYMLAVAIKKYANEVLFDVSTIYKYVVFIFPSFMLILNFILIPILTDFNRAWSLLFILIPIIGKISFFTSNFISKKRYKQFSNSLEHVYILIRKNNLDISKEDLNIRVKNKKSLNIVINVYSSEDEKKVKTLRTNIIKSFLGEKDESKYEIRLLIDKKKDKKIQKIYNTTFYEFS